ncbi:MAG: amidohydrolase, partial [Chloroflexi bacterium]|nr:amidohydrolase [Chloroflexota bacterium]
MQDDIASEARAAAGDVIALRRQLHACPEIGFEETETGAIIETRLREAGLSVRTGVGRTGLVGVLEGGGPGPTLMVRADIDALPITEETGLPFASTNGRMHACGHDGHMAMVVVAAEILARHRDSLRGRAVFVFQPAEEITGGAVAMIDDGVLEEMRPDRLIGLHIWNEVPLGRVGVNRGIVFGGADAIRITVRGRGAHGALPHRAIDPLMAAAQMVSTLQTVVSREVPPNEMGVLTFGQIHGGSAPNVIADEV